MRYNLLIITAILGAFTIVLGAFGAHALKDILTDSLLKSFETAVRYQMYHVLVLLFVNTTDIIPDSSKNKISYAMLIGILLFSGSIYAITLGQVPVKGIWFITPLGGLCFIVGWAVLLLAFVKAKKA
jgi:uncharacterized membrane protein YgdD (TMEM256/DUF423 family)